MSVRECAGVCVRVCRCARVQVCVPAVMCGVGVHVCGCVRICVRESERVRNRGTEGIDLILYKCGSKGK